MKPGPYVLRGDFTPPKLDRRSNDWRKAVVKDGTLFHVVSSSIIEVSEYAEAYPLHGSPSNSVNNSERRGWKKFFEQLEPVGDRPSWYLERHHSRLSGAMVLDQLSYEGKITIQEVEEALERWMERRK